MATSVLDKYLLEGLLSGRPVLKAKLLRTEWETLTLSDRVGPAWQAAGSAACFLDRAEVLFRNSFSVNILGKLFLTGSYVVFLRPDDLTALFVREHYGMQQKLPQPVRAGAGEHDSQGSAGIGISLMVSSAGWHH